MCDDHSIGLEFSTPGCGSGSGEGCGKCRAVPLESGYDSGSCESLALKIDSDNGSTGENNFTPFYHLEKFLCPRFAKYSDAPAAADNDLFTGGEGGVEIESCGWERQVFVDRKPEVVCTDRIVVQDYDDGTIQINDFVVEPDSDLGCGSFCSFKVASCTKDQGLYAIKTMSRRKAKKSAMLFRFRVYLSSASAQSNVGLFSMNSEFWSVRMDERFGVLLPEKDEEARSMDDFCGFTPTTDNGAVKCACIVGDGCALLSGNPFLNIERETAILRKINHPNVVKLFEIMDDPEEDMMYFVFEFMDRGCILSIPTDCPLQEVVAVRYFRDVICGVEYLHSKSIIHRDLKPENMLLNSFERVKLIDFGLSFQYKNNDDTTRLPYGTPSFTAPECLDEQLEEGYSGRAMEIWALGVTLFALLFGHVPYYDDNLFELYRIIQEEPVVFPTKIHISLNIRALLKSLLEKDAKKRIQLEEILDTTLFISKTSPNFLPERCKSCQYYTPSCQPIASSALRQVV